MPVDPAALEELHRRLGEQLATLTTGDQWLEFLKSSRRFHRYSPQNQLLLVMQPSFRTSPASFLAPSGVVVDFV